jgi:transposase
MGIQMSEGTIYSIIKSMSKKAAPVYEIIKEKIAASKVVGGDESGLKIDGKKAWFWVFQNASCSFIKVTYSRAYQSIIDTFPKGFPASIYVSDSLAAQLKINTKAKQLCLAHLMRELKNFENALDDYSKTNPKVRDFENQLTGLLDIDYSNKHKKIQSFIKRLMKNRNSIFTFLYHSGVPPDNNGSEKAIRNAKVKMKISNQFKSFDFANHYAIIRSVIDTTIKNSKNVFDALTCLANQNFIFAE